MTEDNVELDTETPTQQKETVAKLGKIGKILLYGSITVVWITVATLGLIDLWNDKGILETPWIIFGLILTLVIVVVVIFPLFSNVKTGVRTALKEKEEKKIEEES